jgi:eukaryotic-like serine/threonine-protein kinase
MDREAQARWARLEQLFAAACDLSAAERAAFLDTACGGDDTLRAELESLLRAEVQAGDFLSEAAQLPAAAMSQTPHTLAPGTRLGVWEIRAFIGHGGMGEVYLAARADGAYQQRVAIKLLRREAVAHLERFHAERGILARLDHPGIAGLLDGGVAGDGRPWAALEYVEGQTLERHCRARRLCARARLHLLLQVCEAVTHPHRNLILHRDLKPANILIDESGRARLLDFGVAKLVSGDARSDAETQAVLTPDWCAPEQLSGEPVTTATDVYALGLLLFFLLAETRPWPARHQPLARTLRLMLDAPVPAMRAVAAADSPLRRASRQLSGDLEAIVARCLRKEPEHRYPTVEALQQDLQRALDGRPVAAREGARLYVLGRLLRRHRWPVAAVSALLLSLCVGLTGVAWQARRAEQEAAQATAIKNYLLLLFKANDPRIASDRPRGQITARELLDLGSARLEHAFSDRLQLKLELLGVTAELYRELGEGERYRQLHAEQMALARALGGEQHPAAIQGLLREADDARLRGDHAEALARIEQVDALIRRAGLDRSALRARWWLARANALEADLRDWDARMQALTEAAQLFERVAPEDWDRVVTLANIAAAWWERGQEGDAARSRDESHRAIAAADTARERNDADLLVIHTNLGHAEAFLGNPTAAAAAFATAADLARRTHGEHNHRYWYSLGSQAALLHGMGERERAIALFDELLALLPAAPLPADRGAVALALAQCGTALLREGRPRAALPLLEASERHYLDMTHNRYQLHYLRQSLGESYAALGLYDSARRHLTLSLQARLQDNPPDSTPVLSAREAWGRFLLVRGEQDPARKEFERVLADAGAQRRLPVALAHAGLAQLALSQGDSASALLHVEQALSIHEGAQVARDMRTLPGLLWLHARALVLAGEPARALTRAHEAMTAYRRYHHADSNERAAAETWLAELQRTR